MHGFEIWNANIIRVTLGYICSAADCHQLFQSPAHLPFIVKSLHPELPEMCRSAANKPTSVLETWADLAVSAAGSSSASEATEPSRPQFTRHNLLILRLFRLRRAALPPRCHLVTAAMCHR